MLLGIAFVPAVTSIIVAILVAQLQQRAGRRAEHDVDVAARLERIEQRLPRAGRGPADPGRAAHLSEP